MDEQKLNKLIDIVVEQDERIFELEATVLQLVQLVKQLVLQIEKDPAANTTEPLDAQ